MLFFKFLILSKGIEKRVDHEVKIKMIKEENIMIKTLSEIGAVLSIRTESVIETELKIETQGIEVVVAIGRLKDFPIQ